MLSFEITQTGGVRIAGSDKELRTLANYLLEAAVTGQAAPTFVTDLAIARIEIMRQVNNEQ